MEKLADQRENAGGYFSYNEGSVSKCVFYTKGDVPQVLATITFDSTYALAKAQVDAVSRNFTAYETDLYFLRLKAMEDINSDTLYKSYNNTRLNLVPLIHNGQRKVYILTGPQINGIVVFGNDYLLTFDQSNTLVSRRSLHKNIIPIEYGAEDGKEVESTLHSHLAETGDFMTPTDVCTLMLYAKRAGWKQHYVISPKYVSIWTLDKDFILSLTREVWERIYEDQKKRHNK